MFLNAYMKVFFRGSNVKGCTFITSYSSIPRFKGLIKTHKQNDGSLKIRPIINSIDSPCYKMSWLLHNILRKYAMHQRFGADSCNKFMEKIETRIHLIYGLDGFRKINLLIFFIIKMLVLT